MEAILIKALPMFSSFNFKYQFYCQEHTISLLFSLLCSCCRVDCLLKFTNTYAVSRPVNYAQVLNIGFLCSNVQLVVRNVYLDSHYY
jgi:hypothetical protein